MCVNRRLTACATRIVHRSSARSAASCFTGGSLRNHRPDANAVPVETLHRRMLPMEQFPQCALCRRSVAAGSGYVVRIDVFADSELPPMTTEQIEAIDFSATLSDLMEQMKGMSADELQDGVHRRFEYRLCAGCHARYL